jgi:hypothetical protein
LEVVESAELDLAEAAPGEDPLQEHLVEDGHPPRCRGNRAPAHGLGAEEVHDEGKIELLRAARRARQAADAQPGLDRAEWFVAAELEDPEHLVRQEIATSRHGAAGGAVAALVAAEGILPGGLNHSGGEG